ncbi:mycofactocin biosynthesis peptidyl-dipeptidase MftE [Amycolatopsis keratiniphila]|uniref:mycofactocin biosynthesis peptidyl-dipeptidase MftE n=1 Tax=Amycolatopsis keratiniphila TaxID=129921 RepID=UPI00087AD5D7|nr:mycofactocin biosynthesis peptidyl-dipeptidase MftE [Amycolatopsis keratiniphila]OLZ42962.1 mycofactocin system creatininase family protein [Amycolatopsis keratiniphila subsp. nogabecina]SDU66466.1 creatinine amidohydrolase [Amycolatopsis keratiniphila]
MRLADLAWPDIAERAAGGAILAVPVGATEQHGPHLPLTTDTDIAVALCERLAVGRQDVLVAPPVAYGSSGEHAGFAGTVSIGQAATELLLVELGRSASETFQRLLFVSAHGGNSGPVARAVARLRAESRDAEVFQPRWQGDPHAGRPETALQLVLRPESVRMERADAGDCRPLVELLPLLCESGVKAVSGNGVLGDPTSATAREGELLLAELTAALERQVAAWHPMVTR